jgi:HJR/Mrr/RecB family endonuclease
VLTRTIPPVHFEDYSAQEFERLVFAFHLHTGKWRSIYWYGQVGSDLGRDILAMRDDDS